MRMFGALGSSIMCIQEDEIVGLNPSRCAYALIEVSFVARQCALERPRCILEGDLQALDVFAFLSARGARPRLRSVVTSEIRWWPTED